MKRSPFVELIGFRNRLLVLTNWAWDYLFYERVVRLILPRQAEQAAEAKRRDPNPPSSPEEGGQTGAHPCEGGSS